ncbi:5'/3'-nucleotidase SurE [Mycolicibacterium baixiangningiae]|uniref:5'/3'-nucleotidase SurE n=1 Tax=Mycolicibacterium baixiangningiae TaxID=2761578 RepID=UPI001865C12E|nr:5'/3'-nucleotidase SurE [Mycolicibacterium baixiangningiae]
MKVLLTNEDGVGSVGMRALREELIKLGHFVATVAPTTQRSGAGAMVTLDQSVAIQFTGGSPSSPIYSLDGSPVDCVRMGLLSDLLGRVDVVVSGIRHGVNLGEEITSSGTVSAAVAASQLGIPAIAFSQQSKDGALSRVQRSEYSFGLAPLASGLVHQLGSLPPPHRAALIVNLPHERRWTGRVVKASLGRGVATRGAVTRDLTTSGRRYWIWGPPEARAGGFAADPGSDASALMKGHVTLAAVAAEVSEAQIVRAVNNWAAGFVARANERSFPAGSDDLLNGAAAT